MFNNSLLKIAFAPAIVLIVFISAIQLGLYETFWWFDIPVHFLGGASIAISTYYLFQDYGNRKQFNAESKALKILILIAFVALAAVMCELAEYAFDAYMHTHLQESLNDTIKDLCMGIMGGGLTALLITLKRR